MRLIGTVVVGCAGLFALLVVRMTIGVLHLGQRTVLGWFVATSPIRKLIITVADRTTVTIFTTSIFKAVIIFSDFPTQTGLIKMVKIAYFDKASLRRMWIAGHFENTLTLSIFDFHAKKKAPELGASLLVSQLPLR